jgi:thiopeptide-type bacteriocin biosynthesis protein
MAASTAQRHITDSVLAVLAGTPIHQVAAAIGIEPADLADAVETYQTAGHAALQAQAATRDWYQVRIQFADWDRAEHTVANHLGPQLQHAQQAGLLTGWWFIRKAPCWRLRCRPGAAVNLNGTQAAVTAILDTLTAADLVYRWWQTGYEPETYVFGGQPAIDIAHDLFHADSLGILDHLRRCVPTTPSARTLGQRELSLLLCGNLFRAAGQDWHEQGDIWHRVTQLRPLSADTPVDRLPDLTPSVHRLMTADTGPLLGTHGPLADAVPWTDAFAAAGRRLGNAARDGTLQRGIRDILAHHVIFHWNRLGLATRTQSILSRAARDVIMNPSSTLPVLSPPEG